jgi:transposase InsO family protein
LRPIGDHDISSEISGLGVIWHLRGHEVRREKRHRRQQALNANWFDSLEHARELSAEWWTDYNTDHPHSALGGLTPIAYSGAIWAPIPAAPGHGFWNDAGAHSGSIWALIPA